jgi:hypothetical protein
MVHARNSTLRASAVAALVLSISPQSRPRHCLRIASAAAQPLEDDKPTGAHDQIAPDVTLRLSPQQGPASICRKVLIRPRAAEQGLAAIATCGEFMRGASHTECEQAEPTYGFVVIDGTAYEIDGFDCSPLGDVSNSGSGTPN